MIVSLFKSGFCDLENKTVNPEIGHDIEWQYLRVKR